ncbi:hypothetical protein A9Z05_13695 [Burkholderia sp. A2]|nr:hypothetical protein A9Z05_13695 [Burkholderia sp. A2]
MPRDLPRRPPSLAMCSYAMSAAASVSGSVASLNCGLVRERVILRISASSVISTASSRSTNSSSVRFEWPIV